MADFLATADGWLRIDLGMPTIDADPPVWLDALENGRGPVLKGTPYNWLPRNATAEVYSEIAAFAFAHDGTWWDALFHLANHARNAAEHDNLFGYPLNWLITPSKRVPGRCGCCSKVAGHFESTYAGHPAITCESCGELTSLINPAPRL